MLSIPLRRVRAGEVCCEEFLYILKAGPAGGLRPPSGPAATRRSPGNRPHPSLPGGTLTSMATPALTHRGFWTRIVVFTASLLLYAWIVRLMTREQSIAGIVLFYLLILLSGAGLIATVVCRPHRRSR
jgi:hypothetical protein